MNKNILLKIVEKILYALSVIFSLIFIWTAQVTVGFYTNYDPSLGYNGSYYVSSINDAELALKNVFGVFSIIFIIAAVLLSILRIVKEKNI